MKTCIIIAGPTAVGKTAFSIELAKKLGTEIISADSRQCFKELGIGVAKPSAPELASIHHYFINSHSITENVTAATFEKYALHAVDEIFLQHENAVMVGGTGLYIKAFADGMDEIPEVPEEIRSTILAGYVTGGLAWLQEKMRSSDSQYFVAGEIQNPQRMMRALEVKLATGQSILDFQKKVNKERPFRIVKIGLEMPREILYERINTRVDQMIAAGLVQEAKALFPSRHLNALQTVGYNELFEYFEGKHSLERAIDLIKQNTRRYAKRQMTWFKRDSEIHWLETGKKLEDVLEWLEYNKK